MTRLDQIQITEDLTDGIKKHIIQLINDGKIPGTWTGIELRQLVADKAAECVYRGMSRTAKREYNNYVVINNL